VCLRFDGRVLGLGGLVLELRCASGAVAAAAAAVADAGAAVGAAGDMNININRTINISINININSKWQEQQLQRLQGAVDQLQAQVRALQDAQGEQRGYCFCCFCFVLFKTFAFAK